MSTVEAPSVRVVSVVQMPTRMELDAIVEQRQTPAAYFASRELDRLVAMIALTQAAARGVPVHFYLCDHTKGDTTHDADPHSECGEPNRVRALHDAVEQLQLLGWNVRMRRTQMTPDMKDYDRSLMEPLRDDYEHCWRVTLS